MEPGGTGSGGGGTPSSPRTPSTGRGVQLPSSRVGEYRYKCMDAVPAPRLPWHLELAGWGTARARRRRPLLLRSLAAFHIHRRCRCRPLCTCPCPPAIQTASSASGYARAAARRSCTASRSGTQDGTMHTWSRLTRALNGSFSTCGFARLNGCCVCYVHQLLSSASFGGQVATCSRWRRSDIRSRLPPSRRKTHSSLLKPPHTTHAPRPAPTARSARWRAAG
jgi:hypothetical protein